MSSIAVTILDSGDGSGAPLSPIPESFHLKDIPGDRELLVRGFYLTRTVKIRSDFDSDSGTLGFVVVFNKRI